MRIGIDASRAFLKERTGTEEYSYQLIKALAKIDRKNQYTLYVKKNFPREAGSRSARQFSIRQPTDNFQLPKNFRFQAISWPYLWTQVGLALECLKSPPDVLFIPAHTLPILRWPNLKTVVTIHDLGAEFLPQSHKLPHKLYLNKATEYASGYASQIIAVSESTKNDLINKLHCDPKKISVIYEGYDREKFNPSTSPRGAGLRSGQEFKSGEVKKKYGIDGDYILFVGTIQPRKNLVRLIEAFSVAKKQSSNSTINLVIIGKPGWMCEEIYEAPQKFGIGDKVKFLNYVSQDDLPVFYQNARCFVLPSLYEGFGLPILEAMACGCPVLASNSSSLPEILGRAGILVDPLSVEEIAKNLKLVIDSPQLQKTLAEKGLAQVKKFSWEKCARETLEVLENS